MTESNIGSYSNNHRATRRGVLLSRIYETAQFGGILPFHQSGGWAVRLPSVHLSRSPWRLYVAKSNHIRCQSISLIEWNDLLGQGWSS